MSYIGAYQVTYCPRYSESAFKQESREFSSHDLLANMLVQKSLWNALRLLIAAHPESGVELRFSSMRKSRRLTIQLLIFDKNKESAVESFALDVVERLLPGEYGWERITLQNGLLPSAESDFNGPWRVARLIRQIELFDLPLGWLPLSQNAPTTTSQEPLKEKRRAPIRNRRVPIPLLRLESQAIAAQLSLPYMPFLEETLPDRHRFCQEVIQSAPTIVSISLHNPNPMHLELDRQYVHFFQDFLYAGKASQNAPGDAIALANATYQRYWRPVNQVCHVVMRVASSSDSDALGVANSLAAHFGGVRTFHILSPQNDIMSINSINHPVERSETWYDGWCDTIGLAQDTYYCEFLSRMPLLYEIDDLPSLFRLPFATDAGLPGMETRLVTPFYPPAAGLELDNEAPRPDAVRIGYMRGAMAGLREEAGECHWHAIPAIDLCKHALIVGSTGSGKTVATTHLVHEAARLNIPFLIVEPVKTEYYDALRKKHANVNRVRLEGGASGKAVSDYFLFDPMRLQYGVSVARHVSYLKACFEAAFPLDPVQSLVLENGLRLYYQRSRDESTGQEKKSKWTCGLGAFVRGGKHAHRIIDGNVFPSFHTFSRFFLDEYLEEAFAMPGGGKNLEFIQSWKQLFKRRFENLSGGPLGTAFRLADNRALRYGIQHYNPFNQLLAEGSVIELDGLTDPEQKSLVMAFILTFLFERRQADDLLRREKGTPETIRVKPDHLLIIEEAHRLLSRENPDRGGDFAGQSAGSKAVSMFVDMLAEIRAYGQAIAIVEQIPTKIAPAAIKNTNLKVMLRLTSREDRDYLGEAMNFNEDQKRFVTNLQPGNCVVFEEKVEQPILLTVPFISIGENRE